MYEYSDHAAFDTVERKNIKNQLMERIQLKGKYLFTHCKTSFWDQYSFESILNKAIFILKKF